MSTDSVNGIARAVRSALESDDLEQLVELLDPDVQWGAPGDPTPSCRNRRQVLAWYQRGTAAGRRTSVVTVTTRGDKILVATRITHGADDAGEDRWQVLTVAGGRIADIRGYDNEDAAVEQLGASPRG